MEVGAITTYLPTVRLSFGFERDEKRLLLWRDLCEEVAVVLAPVPSPLLATYPSFLPVGRCCRRRQDVIVKAAREGLLAPSSPPLCPVPMKQPGWTAGSASDGFGNARRQKSPASADTHCRDGTAHDRSS